MDTTTHERFAAGLMKAAGVPVNMKLIRNVNWDIDNSPGYVMAMGHFLRKKQKLRGNVAGTKFMSNNPNDLFNVMGVGGHRSYGHDLTSGLLIAAQNARSMGLPASRGMLPVFAHYMADSMSNRMVSRMGTEGRNLFQAMFNWQTRRNQQNKFSF